ncbi:MAG: hypothetical protein JJE13_04400 [Thermoleophilia bacterium]|nr:hypothetical protein [Thermoleophilia bacterium]
MVKKIHSRFRLTLVRVRKLFRLLSDRSYWPALRQGVAASVEHSRIPLRPDIKTVLDVGASRGQFALFAARNRRSSRAPATP